MLLCTVCQIVRPDSREFGSIVCHLVARQDILVTKQFSLMLISFISYSLKINTLS